MGLFLCENLRTKRGILRFKSPEQLLSWNPPSAIWSEQRLRPGVSQRCGRSSSHKKKLKKKLCGECTTCKSTEKLAAIGRSLNRMAIHQKLCELVPSALVGIALCSGGSFHFAWSFQCCIVHETTICRWFPINSSMYWDFPKKTWRFCVAMFDRHVSEGSWFIPTWGCVKGLATGSSTQTHTHTHTCI